MQDELAALEGGRHLGWQRGQHLAHVRVGDHADADGVAQMAIAW